MEMVWECRGEGGTPVCSGTFIFLVSKDLWPHSVTSLFPSLLFVLLAPGREKCSQSIKVLPPGMEEKERGRERGRERRERNRKEKTRKRIIARREERRAGEKFLEESQAPHPQSL